MDVRNYLVKGISLDLKCGLNYNTVYNLKNELSVLLFLKCR